MRLSYIYRGTVCTLQAEEDFRWGRIKPYGRGEYLVCTASLIEVVSA